MNVLDALRAGVRDLLQQRNQRDIELARGTGMKPGSVSGFLSGRKGLSFEKAERIRRHFGVEPHDLFKPTATAADSSDRSRVSPSEEVAMPDRMDGGRTIAGLWTHASPHARDEMYDACLRIALKDRATVGPVSQGGEGKA